MRKKGGAPKDKKNYSYEEYYEMGREAAQKDPRFRLNKKIKVED